ncbi:phage tail sheath family protein [Mycetohabitans sp. B2]|uniref:phage tail sheath family protein n=1 Tax=Mycetohabitans sp. B2 TaxID=2841274 RepID=UPI001F1689FA|nr:phage tail sheath C-terminal domain-containing protein [Mycetohabitans sp. B2]MCF7697014.1 phage tail sheath family protein [Mycetohabitans sp. B2]
MAYDWPGVYVEEERGLSLAITSGATAVPVIAYELEGSTGKDKDKAVNKDLISAPARIDSWMAFMNLPGVQTVAEAEAENPPKKRLLDCPLYIALKTYFDNGGGYCYVCPTNGKGDTTDTLIKIVPELDDVTLIVQAGGPKLADAVFTPGTGLCAEGKSRFAILDGPSIKLDTDPSKSMTKDYPNSSYAAAYYPPLQANWATYVTKDKEKDVQVIKDIPVSAAVAGAYCSVDRDRGVWKAPANVPLQGGVVPKFVVSDATQGIYNQYTKPLNIIRCFQTGVPLVWGARTLADDSEKERWRYVPVRRLFSAAEKDIKRAMAFAVFEPNNQPTWEKVRAAIDAYLHGIWKAGGLMGTKPEEAYFVRLGLGVTMTQAEIDEGKMIVQVGMAPVFPAEFIILRFTQDMHAA